MPKEKLSKIAHLKRSADLSTVPMRTLPHGGRGWRRAFSKLSQNIACCKVQGNSRARALIDNCNLDPQLKKQVERAVSRYQPESKAINSPSGEQPSASANRASTFHKSTSAVRPRGSRRQ